MPPELNPIRYADIVRPDSSIKDAISQLKQLKGIYEETLASISSSATSFQTKLRPVSVGISEQREVIKNTAEATDNLFASYKAVSQEVIDVDAKIKVLSSSLDNVTKLTKEQALARKSYSIAALADAKVQTEIANKDLLNAKTSTEASKQLTLELNRQVQAKKLDVMASKESERATKQEETSKRSIIKTIKEKVAQSIEEIVIAKEAKQIAALNAVVTNNNADSYNRLSAQYNLNKINLNKYSQEVIASSKFLSAQQEESKHLYTEMSRLQEVTGKHTLQVGNYRRAWNGLSVATSQVVRELPAAAMGMNTFFLAISNNIPILMDEIQNLRLENKALQAEGKATISVGKQMLKSLLSFNTVMVILLTVFSMFGTKIVAWIEDLIKGDAAIKKLTASQMGLLTSTEAMRKGLNGSEYQKAVEGINKMSSELKNAKGNHDLERQAVDDYNKSLGITFGKAKDVDGALKLIRDNKDAYIQAMQAMTFANVFFGVSAEDAVKRMDINMKSQKELLKDAGKDAESLQGQYYDLGERIRIATLKGKKENDNVLVGEDTFTVQQLIDNRQMLAKQIIKIETDERRRQTSIVDKHSEEALKKAVEYNTDYTKIFKDNKWTTTESYATGKTPEEKATEAAEKALREKLSAAKANMQIQKEYSASINALEEDSLLQQKITLKNALQDETDELMAKYVLDAKLTKESKAQIIDIIVNKHKAFNVAIADIDLKEQQRKLSTEQETLNLQLDKLVEGTNDYYAVKAQLVENARKQALIKNRLAITAERQDEKVINAAYDKQMLDLMTSKSDAQFEQYQKYQESEFNLLRRTEEEKTKFKLQQERDRYVRLLELAKTGAKVLSQVEITTYTNMIADINKQLAQLKSDNFDIYKMLGLKVDDNQKKAISQSVNMVVDNLKNMFSAEQELAQKAVDVATNATDAKKTRLQEEIEARNNGYASNVALAEKELASSKKAQEKALREQQKYQKAQETIDTISQTSSLITASASLWKAMAPLGGLGIGLAIAGIATMFGTFIEAKAKASQLSKTQTKVYGEGGTEMLNGGSHQSGHDIDLGTTSDGKNRRAEGGEMLAIINKRNTRKYRSTIPAIIDSLNRGNFEQKFALTSGNTTYVESHNTDLRILETEVQSIRRQGERKYMFDAKGNVIEVYRNLTRRYK